MSPSLAISRAIDLLPVLRSKTEIALVIAIIELANEATRDVQITQPELSRVTGCSPGRIRVAVPRLARFISPKRGRRHQGTTYSVTEALVPIVATSASPEQAGAEQNSHSPNSCDLDTGGATADTSPERPIEEAFVEPESASHVPEPVRETPTPESELPVEEEFSADPEDSMPADVEQPAARASVSPQDQFRSALDSEQAQAAAVGAGFRRVTPIEILKADPKSFTTEQHKYASEKIQSHQAAFCKTRPDKAPDEIITAQILTAAGGNLERVMQEIWENRKPGNKWAWYVTLVANKGPSKIDPKELKAARDQIFEERQKANPGKPNPNYREDLAPAYAARQRAGPDPPQPDRREPQMEMQRSDFANDLLGDLNKAAHERLKKMNGKG